MDFQLIAANIDTAFIIQSMDENFNLRRLERYLVMINESSITPIVLLSKADLLSTSKIEENINSILALMPEVKVIPFSNENGINMDDNQKPPPSGKNLLFAWLFRRRKNNLTEQCHGEFAFGHQPRQRKRW